jgi:hypothetical protein
LVLVLVASLGVRVLAVALDWYGPHLVVFAVRIVLHARVAVLDRDVVLVVLHARVAVLQGVVVGALVRMHRLVEGQVLQRVIGRVPRNVLRVDSVGMRIKRVVLRIDRVAVRVKRVALGIERVVLLRRVTGELAVLLGVRYPAVLFFSVRHPLAAVHGREDLLLVRVLFPNTLVELLLVAVWDVDGLILLFLVALLLHERDVNDPLAHDELAVVRLFDVLRDEDALASVGGGGGGGRCVGWSRR